MTDNKPSSMAKFRKENKRVDYFPTSRAVAAIELLRKHYPDAPTRALIDMLCVEGIKTLVPKVAS